MFPWVQALRAMAAAWVAWYHIAHEAMTAGLDRTGVIAAAHGFMPWVAGVDIFFVISGFVIIHASGRLFAQPDGWAAFLRRRLTRVVPLYWVLTTLFLLIAASDHSAVHNDSGGLGYVLASYAFIPWARPDGLIEPLLGLGWTLNYEMFFYLLLTPFLLLRRPWAVMGSALVLCTLVANGQVFDPAMAAVRFWCDPIILEFGFGMGLALAASAGFTLPGWMRGCLAAAALFLLHAATQLPPDYRAIVYGLPATMLVAAAVSGRGPEPTGRVALVMLGLGDASYAMYLFHPFVMRVLSASFWRPDGSKSEGVIYVAITLIAAQTAAIFIHQGFERKVTQALRRWFQRRP